MKQLLVFTQRAELRQYLANNWEDSDGCFPVFCSTVEELKNLLQLFNRIDILVLDRVTSVDLSSIDELLADSQRVIHNFSLADDNDPLAAETFHPLDWLTVVEKVRSLCTPQAVKSEDYIGIPADTLVHFQQLPFSLFIRLQSGRFIKRIPAYEPIDQKMINEYAEKGMRVFFFDRRFGRDYINLLLNNMLNRLDAQYLQRLEKSQAYSEVFQTVQDIVSSIGMKPRVVSLCEALINHVQAEVEEMKSGSAYEYLKELRENSKMVLPYRFIQLTCFLGAHIHPPGHLLKADVLVKSAFFSDISLKNPDSLHFRTSALVEMLPEEEKLLVPGHAALSASIIQSSGIVSQEVVQIIREHHGDPLGESIPSKPSTGISEEARCLLVAQELAHAFLTRPSENHWKVFWEVARKYENTFLAEYFLSFEANFLNDEKIIAS